jgi:hypothetical protein
MEEHEFDLDQEMLAEISVGFDPAKFLKSLDLKDAKNVEGASGAFEKYGRDLARRSIERGEQRVDRVYEVMKQVIEKTGEMKFPLIPQRFVEIAYLSIQPIKRLRILANSPKVLSYRLNGCSVYDAVAKECGEEAAKKMICKSACFGLIDEIFSHFDVDIESSLETNMAADGKCQFKIEKR